MPACKTRMKPFKLYTEFFNHTEIRKQLISSILGEVKLLGFCNSVERASNFTLPCDGVL